MLIGCSPINEVVKTPGPEIKYNKCSADIKLRRDGLYTTYDTSICENLRKRNCDLLTAQEPIVIINDSNLFFSAGVIYEDSLPFKLEKYFHPDYKKYMEKYQICGNIITAKVCLVSWKNSMTYRIHEAYFSGKIISPDTISDWKMIKPYPKINFDLEVNMRHITKPKLLVFRKGEDLKGLDSLFFHSTI